MDATSSMGATPAVQPNRLRRIGVLAAPPLFLLLWANGFVGLKLGLRDADPLTFLCVRYVLVLAIQIPVALVLRPRFPDWRGMFDVAVVGVLVQAGYFGFAYLAGEVGMSAGAIALVTSMQPILVALLAPWLASESVSAQRWIGLILGLAGAATVILARAGIEPEPALGLLLSVASLLCMTGGTLCQKRFGRPNHPVAESIVQYAVGLACLLPAAALLEPMRLHPTWQLAGALAYLVLGNSVLAMSLLMAMIRAGEAARVSALFFVIPPITAVFAWLLLHEPVPPAAWAGMALASGGVWLATTPRRVLGAKRPWG